MYAWITPEEADDIARLRSQLDARELAQLQAAPADIRHDLMLCRFLRGHGKKALQALRSHLRYRQENHALLERVRANLPPDLDEFNLDLCPGNSQFELMFATLQCPASQGTNDGMMLSLMPLQFFNVASWTASEFGPFLEWFLATVEMRSICLHNQSLKERRMAKVTEARDCVGFKFFNFFGSLMGMRRFATMLQYAMYYPEFMGVVLVYNLEPGSRTMGMIRRIVPAEFADKLLFIDRGDWKAVISTPQGLSLNAVLRWTEYIKGHQPNWRSLSSDVPQTVWALSVPGPCKVS